MSKMIFPLLILFSVTIASKPHFVHAESLFNLKFHDLKNWEPLNFKKIKEHSVYEIKISESGEKYLATSSNKSASGLVYDKEFNVKDYPILKWKWRINNILATKNVTLKSEDDYPLRIYLIFRHPPDHKYSFFEGLKNTMVNALSEEDPPHSSLTYVWSSTLVERVPFPNPYTSRVQMIALRSGEKQIGEWLVEKVNIYEDYIKAFGEAPPSVARIAIMADSDNTSGKTSADIMSLEVSSLK